MDVPENLPAILAGVAAVLTALARVFRSAKGRARREQDKLDALDEERARVEAEMRGDGVRDLDGFPIMG